ncbi:iron ABC transporter permease [Porticoccaceae bacterium]|nr:iron ABC transporter permease [Porticoccaceae bacterium]MDB2566305.1 iron ABC transporter permease [Porticoccaceae bacterium]MDB2621147.1 iron ABC transporter permease [Porticoccaceae bacterium]MDB2669605.1 iron ABC transporter permease [Porticoccaceae bacterium]
MRRVSAQGLTILLWVSLPVAVMLGLNAGTVNIPIDVIIQQSANLLLQSSSTDIHTNQINTILLDIRLSRICLAFLIGAILAISGAVMQGLFRNPLAAPSLIGVSSGASVGASIVIVLAGTWLQNNALLGLSVVAVGAFVGSFLITLLVFRLSTSTLGTSVTTMLLAGIAISALAGAVNSLLSYFADNEMLRQISIWQMGNLSTANWARVSVVAVVAVFVLVLFPRESKSLNALLLGESEARHLGIDVQRVKKKLILLTTLGIGTAVAVAGMIGFVGLIVPHMVRLLIGPDHRWLLPVSALAGGILLLIADTLARVIIAPVELPTGILTAILGAPFFIMLLIQQRREL